MIGCPEKLGGLVLACLLFFLPEAVLASQEEGESSQARLYRSPEERREASGGREIIDGLRASALYESETEWVRTRFQTDNEKLRTRESSNSVQLGLHVELSDAVEAVLIYEYDTRHGHGLIDEFKLEFDNDTWAVSAGRDNIDFGEFYSHFVSGPMVEFGEIRADALSVGYKLNPQWEFVVQGFKAKVENVPDRLNDYETGLFVFFTSADEAVEASLGWVSDLSAGDEAFYEEDFERHSPVAGVNASLLWLLDRWELTAELTRSLEKFQHLESHLDQPSAFNLELAWLPTSRWQLAVRLEHSQELEEEASRRWGIASSWLLDERIHLTAEYLEGRFDADRFEEEDEVIRRERSAALQLGIQF